MFDVLTKVRHELLTATPVVARRAISYVLATLCVTGSATRSVVSTAQSRDPDAKEWIELFNGRNLDGWIPKIAKYEVGNNFANTFRVVDGMLVARYDGYDGDQWVLSEALVLGDSIVRHIVNHDTVLTYTRPQQMPGVVTGFDPKQLV